MESQPGFCATHTFIKQTGRHSAHFLRGVLATLTLPSCFKLGPLLNSVLPLCPPRVCFSLSFSPSHKHLLWGEKTAAQGPTRKGLVRDLSQQTLPCQSKEHGGRAGWFMACREPCCDIDYSGCFLLRLCRANQSRGRFPGKRVTIWGTYNQPLKPLENPETLQACVCS